MLGSSYLGFKEQLICSHKYKATVSANPLSATRKFFDLFFLCLLHNAPDTKKASRMRAGLSGFRRCSAGGGPDYCRSDMTIDDIWLVCLSIAVPACISIWLEVIFALSDAKSTSMIRPVAFCVLVLMFDRLL